MFQIFVPCDDVSDQRLDAMSRHLTKTYEEGFNWMLLMRRVPDNLELIVRQDNGKIMPVGLRRR